MGLELAAKTASGGARPRRRRRRPAAGVGCAKKGDTHVGPPATTRNPRRRAWPLKKARRSGASLFLPAAAARGVVGRKLCGEWAGWARGWLRRVTRARPRRRRAMCGNPTRRRRRSRPPAPARRPPRTPLQLGARPSKISQRPTGSASFAEYHCPLSVRGDRGSTNSVGQLSLLRRTRRHAAAARAPGSKIFQQRREANHRQRAAPRGSPLDMATHVLEGPRRCISRGPPELPILAAGSADLAQLGRRAAPGHGRCEIKARDVAAISRSFEDTRLRRRTIALDSDSSDSGRGKRGRIAFGKES